MNDDIRAALASLPDWVLSRSGSVFYSGKEAFAEQQNTYILGLNPGGDPAAQQGNSVRLDIERHFVRDKMIARILDSRFERPTA